MNHLIDRFLLEWLLKLRSTLKGWLAGRQHPLGKSPNRQKGDSGEVLAYHFLRKNGYKIVARKYKRRSGEIDLIGWDNDILSFIEVKFRTHLDHGRPEEAVRRHKQQQICRVAREYRNSHNLHDINYRYDIVSIHGSGESPRLHIIKGAFREPPNRRS
jgi:putative endonuclease